MTKLVEAWNPPISWVKEKIEAAGTTIGSVHFTKRENGELRKMSYRLHVTSPSVAKAPKGIKTVCTCGISTCQVGPFKKVPSTKDRKTINTANNQMTVLDANKVVRDEAGNIIGRGQWRTIPLENVLRIKAKGEEIIIHRS
jgi:hypothetical protein